MLVELAELAPILRDLFAMQRYAVLASQSADRISLDLMALAIMDDLRGLIMATERATLKYANLKANSRVSLLVDNRSNQSGDTQHALALSIDGLAEEASGIEREQLVKRFLVRHPQMESFVRLPDCAMFRVRVERYRLVRGLHDIREAQLP